MSQTGQANTSDIETLRAELTILRLAVSKIAEDAPRAAEVSLIAPHVSVSPSATVTAADVRRIIRIRGLRREVFPNVAFEDPAWNMMLALFMSHLSNIRVSITALAAAAEVPWTTASRWMVSMEKDGLLERCSDDVDRRRSFMALSVQAVAGMHTFFELARDAGLRFSEN